MSKKEEATEQNEDDQPDNYKVSKKVSVGELMNLDKGDESLQKYKQSLGLGTSGYSPSDDPRKVVITEMRIIIEGRPDIIYKLDDKKAVEELKSKPFTLKAGCNYKLQLSFRIQHDLVTGLKYVNTFQKMIFKTKENLMIGSFAPQKESYTFQFPRIGWSEAPSGLGTGGKYSAKSQFIDDDKQEHLSFDWSFEIHSDWKS